MTTEANTIRTHALGVQLNPRQLEILQHALGLDEYGRVKYYRDDVKYYGFAPTRNHFCAGGSDETICRELVAMGYMWNWVREYLPYYNCSVTDEGKEAVRRESPAPPPEPKLTRSQKRYRDFLDADSGLSFREWLGYRRAQ